VLCCILKQVYQPILKSLPLPQLTFPHNTTVHPKFLSSDATDSSRSTLALNFVVQKASLEWGS
jgi:hypothetical protein